MEIVVVFVIVVVVVAVFVIHCRKSRAGVLVWDTVRGIRRLCWLAMAFHQAK